MFLRRINEFYQGSDSEQYNLYGFGVYSDRVADMQADKAEERLGIISDVLLNEMGQLKYLVVDLGLPIVGRQILLSGDKIRIDSQCSRVYASEVTRDQISSLPEYSTESLRSHAR